jgi:hypothetical protein
MSLAGPNHVSVFRSNTGFHELRVVRQDWRLLDYQLSPLTGVCQGKLLSSFVSGLKIVIFSPEKKLLKRRLKWKNVTGGFAAKRERLDNI